MIFRFVMVLTAATLVTRGSASADDRTVLLMLDDRRDAMAEALELELAGLSLAILAVGAPSGVTALSRDAAAQTAAHTYGSLVAVRIERAPVERGGGAMVRVIGAEADHVRLAPLPGVWEDVDPRTFAVVAHSLMDELVAPPEPIQVTVRVDVDAPGREVTVTDAVVDGERVVEPAAASGAEALGAVPAPPRTSTAPAVAVDGTPVPTAPAGTGWPTVPVDEVDEDLPLLPRSGFYLEGGPMTAILAWGAKVALSYHVAESFRLGAYGIGVAVIDEGPAFSVGGELTHVGGSASWRFDIGASLGALFVQDTRDRFIDAPCFVDGTGATICTTTLESDTTYLLGWTGGAFVGLAWELSAGFGLGLRFAMNVAQVDGGDPVPAPLLTLHGEVPL